MHSVLIPEPYILGSLRGSLSTCLRPKRGEVLELQLQRVAVLRASKLRAGTSVYNSRGVQRVFATSASEHS